MKILKKIVLALIILIAVLAIIGLFLPRSYKVERSIVINAPAGIIFDQVNDLKKMNSWSPWRAMDSTIKVSYGSVTTGQGASHSWTSKKSGEGTETIEVSAPNDSIVTAMEFKGMGTAQGNWYFTPEDGGVRVTQTMSGDYGANPFKRYMGLMTDKIVGPNFEKGLVSLKEISEAKAAEMKTAEATAMQAADTLSTTPPPPVPAGMSVNPVP